MKIKILICIGIVFLVSFTIFETFSYFFPSRLTSSQDKFFSQDFDIEKKVILIGSSHVGQLNTTYIEEMVISKNHDYKIYNLAYQGDMPERRIKSSDKILELKPTLVLYGISYRDFPSSVNPPLFDPKQYFHDLFIGDQDDFGINNPKLTTLEFIRDISKKTELVDSSNELTFQNTPFFTYDTTTQLRIASNKELELQKGTSEATKIHLEKPFPPSANRQTTLLIKMINNLKMNGINVVLFTTPLHKIYLDELPNSEKQTFDEILERIKKGTNVKIYDLTDKYSDLPIWTNISHVAYNKNATIYSEDVAKIILGEIEP